MASEPATKESHDHQIVSDQHVAEREKEIAKYLQRMERVLTQAERMHTNTHVQPARRRHSLSNSQESLKAIIGSTPDEAVESILSEASAGSSAHPAAPQQQSKATQAQDTWHLGRLRGQPDESNERKTVSTDPGQLCRPSQRQTRPSQAQGGGHTGKHKEQQKDNVPAQVKSHNQAAQAQEGKQSSRYRSPPTESVTARSQPQEEAAQAEKDEHLGRDRSQPNERSGITSAVSLDPGDFFALTDGDSTGLLDTSATLADWIMQSTSSVADVSQHEADEVTEVTAEVEATHRLAPALAYPSQMLESLSEWAHEPNEAGHKGTASDSFTRAKTPVSFPIVLSATASPSRATSSPAKPFRASHAGRPSGSAARTAMSACATSDTGDTADSASASNEQHRHAGVGLEHGLRSLPQTEAGFPWQHVSKTGGSGSDTTIAAQSGRPGQKAIPHNSGTGDLQHPSPRPHRGQRARNSPKHSAATLGSDAQPFPAHSVKNHAAGREIGQAEGRKEASCGSDESAQQQVPALQKLKLRVRSRQRTSLQSSGLKTALHSLKLTYGDLPAAGESCPPESNMRTALQSLKVADSQLPAASAFICAPQMAFLPSQKVSIERATGYSMPEASNFVASPTISAKTAPGPVPAEEHMVFAASRMLPRSPLKGSPQTSDQSVFGRPTPTPTQADIATVIGTPSHSPAKQAEAESSAPSSVPPSSHGRQSSEAVAVSSRLQPCREPEPNLALSPQQQPGSPPGSGVLAINSLLFPAVTNVQHIIEAHEGAVFTPSHKLARSPPKQQDAHANQPEDSLSQPSTCSFPQQHALTDGKTPETPRMAATAVQSPHKHTSACVGTPEAVRPRQSGQLDNPACAEELREEKASLARLPVMSSTRPASDKHALQQEALVPKLPMSSSAFLTPEKRAQQQTACRDSPRHAGAPPSRLPRPPSAASPRPNSSRGDCRGVRLLKTSPGLPRRRAASFKSLPSSGGDTKLPNAPVGLPNAQSPQPVKGSAFHSRQAQQQAEEVLHRCAQPCEKQKSGDEAISAKLSRIPSASPQHQRHLKVDTAPATKAAARPASSGDDARQNRNPSSLPVRAKGQSQFQEGRRSSTGPYVSGSTSPNLRRKTSPAAPGAAKKPLSDRLKAKQSSSRSPPEKAAIKQRLSLGAPQRIRSPAQQGLDVAGSSGITKPKSTVSPANSTLQGLNAPEHTAAHASSRLQGKISSIRKTRSKPSTGRDTVLSAVGKLPIDILMGSMHGALMD